MPAAFERQMTGSRVHHHELAVWALMSPGTTLPALSIGVCPLQKIRPGIFTACEYIGTSILSGLLIFSTDMVNINGRRKTDSRV